MLAIVDYGVSNLRSVHKAFEYVGAQAIVTGDPAVIAAADAVVFPGQGAFGDAMRHLRQHGLVQPLQDAVASGRPFFGICLGLQLLFEESDEMGRHTGLGMLPGRVERLRTEFKIPHIGWNQIHPMRPHPLLAGVQPGAYAYFDHSYVVRPTGADDTLATTDYGEDFVCAVAHGNVMAVQFHPEKSQQVGLRIVRNFVALAGQLPGVPAAHIVESLHA
ncbi:MAG: imidazole glycerol phosphate synthase subunit HisH [Anaerolineae bacterium]|nr:imidazole glycerol phosphate synthase subunit HisH [Anaerolineae bacterium]